jgi:iron(III) transport system ATP-binding protein
MTVFADNEIERGWRGWGRRGTAGASIPVSCGFENIWQRFGDVTALAGVNLTIDAGEVVCLLGQSGCGKSTLLRVAAGVERPSAGRVLLDGREVAGPERFVDPERRGVGLMFQEYALFPHLSVLDNVCYGIRGLAAADMRASALRALDRVGLAGMADAFPHMLSGGEQQRVALARAVAPRPGVLLMDEPFVSLDPPTARQVRQWLISLWLQRPHTVLFVTHDLREAIALADRLIFLSKSPMTAVSEIKVPIPRSERDDEKAVEAFRQYLLENHPEIRSLL